MMEAAILTAVTCAGLVVVFYMRLVRSRSMHQIADGISDGADADQYGDSFEFLGVPLQKGVSFDYVTRRDDDRRESVVVRVEVPFVEGRFEPGQTVDPRLRALFDHLDGYAVQRFDSRIRMAGVAVPFELLVDLPPRANEIVATLTCCYMRSADEVLSWLLAQELRDPEWFGDLIVTTLAHEDRVRQRARERVEPLQRDEPVTDSLDLARAAVRWAPVLGEEAAEILRRVADGDVRDDVSHAAGARLNQLDPAVGLLWAVRWIEQRAFRPGRPSTATLRLALGITRDRGEMDVIEPLVDAVIRSLDSPVADKPSALALSATRAVLERAHESVPDSVRARLQTAMNGPWWAYARSLSLADALAVVGLVQPDGVEAVMLDGMGQADHDEIATWIGSLGAYGGLTAVQPLMEVADGWSGRGGVRHVAEQAIAQIQDRCVKGAAGGLAISADEGMLAVVSGADSGALSAPSDDG